jgi:hypothetical protein
MEELSVPLTEESVRTLFETAGARVMSRGGRTEHYGSPREFSFEVKAAFENGLVLHVLARQYVYRDPWEAQGRVNDVVDVSLLRDGQYTSLPKGYEWFQSSDEETGVDRDGLERLITIIRSINPKLFILQRMTGDL